MGKSNAIVFPWYRKCLNDSVGNSFKRVCVLGATGVDGFTSNIVCEQMDFFDLTLGNWKINDPYWHIQRMGYDLVICTRCPYFAEDPRVFIERCLDLVDTGGKVFLDWGLGDHWRQDPYKVGWVRDGHHEAVIYGDHESRLWSCCWNPLWEHDQASQDFLRNVEKFGYVDRKLTDIINEEVPNVAFPGQNAVFVELMSLWPDSPQLYICTVIGKD